MPNTLASENLIVPASKFTSLDIRGLWDLKNDLEKISNLPKVVLMENGEPIIEILNFSNQKSYHELEELWTLESSFVKDKYGKGTRLTQEVLYYRAKLGVDIIRTVWAENGYSNKDETLKSTKVIKFLSPIANEKATRKASLAKEQVLPTLEFGVKDNVLGWMLRIEGTLEILAFVKWNDWEAIRDLAAKILNKKYFLTMFALGNPEKSRRLFEQKERYANELILYKFLPRFAIQGEHKEFVNQYIKKLEDLRYRIGGGSSNYLMFSNLAPQILTNPDKPWSREDDQKILIGDHLSIQISFPKDSWYPLPEEEKRLVWEENEQKLWDIFLEKNYALGNRVLQLPVDNFETVISRNGKNNVTTTRSAIICKDETIYNEYLEQPGVWPSLVARAKKVFEEEKVQ